MTFAYWHWLILGMLLMGIELFLPTFTILWFGLGAVLVGVVAWVWDGMSLAIQVLLWAVASSLFTWVWFRYFKRMAPDRTNAGMSQDAIIGESGIVISIPSQSRRGVLRFSRPLLGSEEWQFICEQSLAVGDRVFVQGVSGNTLMVSKTAS
jgi:inner membrane protein